MTHPWALLLLIPALAAWWRWGRTGHGRWWRLAALVLLVAAATGLRRPGAVGSDVILVLDRSESLGARREAQAELVRLAAAARGPGDRLGVVAVGAGAQVVAAPLAEGLPDLAQATVDPNATELAAGLRLARALVGTGRPGRLVVVSDGEDTGADPVSEAAVAAGAGLVVDALSQAAPGRGDAAVLDVELPGVLRLGESFAGAARLVSERTERRAWKALRGDTVLAEGQVDLRPGVPATVVFADRPPRPGIAAYRVVLDATDDRQPLNNEAQACLRVDGGERVLVMSGDGRPGNLATALTAAGLRVESRAEGPLSLGDLTAFSAVVLEQVPASRLGRSGQEALATWVRHGGGGLVMTGGRRGFGGGGWRKSPVEDVLPVSCEVRDEHRKLAVAMAIALDRSGSMSAPVAGGRTKMDLADEGACAAIELLGPRDRVAVLAVDTAAHDIVPLTAVTGRGSILSAVRGIVSQGGGINVRTALEAAGAQVLRADTGTRHIILFADASDADEQDGSVALTDDLVRAGVTVSVVAMGQPTDGDAAFLQEVARHGGGRCLFATVPEDIPRLFAQETLLVSRSTWVDQAITPAPQAPLAVALPGLPALPTVPGYNLTYLRDGAQRWAWCAGDPEAPGLAAWRIGSGRSVALGFDQEALGAWPGRAALLSGCVRWVAGGGAREAGLSVRRTGRILTLTLTAPPTAMVEPAVRLLTADGKVREAGDLVRTGAATWTATTVLEGTLPVLPVVRVDGDAVMGPPSVVPYGPEAEPRGDRPEGIRVLADVARVGGGRLREDLERLYADLPPVAGGERDLTPPLVILALLVLLTEIAVRRFGLGWPRWRWSRRTAPAPGTVPAPASPAASTPVPASAPAEAPGSKTTTPNVPTEPEQSALSQALRRRQR